MAETRRTGTTTRNTKPEQPLPTELAKLRANVFKARQNYGRARLEGAGRVKLALAFFQELLARLNAFRPLRAFQHYSLRHGPLLSAGIGFNMFFSILGLLATGFSIAGLVLAGQPELVDRVVRSVAQSAPGLLKVDGQEGLADPKALLNPSGLGITAIVAAVVTILTSLGWITSLRDGLRGVVDAPRLTTNPLVQRLRDAGTLLLLGVALVLTSGVSILFTAALGFVESALQLDPAVVAPIGWLIGIIVPFLLNWLTAVIMFRLAGGLELTRRALVEGTLIAGIGTSILQLFSSQLLARAGANPLLASFAIIVGLLIWFNLVSQVYLVSAAWAAIREADTVPPGRRRGAPFGSARPTPHASRALARARSQTGPARRASSASALAESPRPVPAAASARPAAPVQAPEAGKPARARPLEDDDGAAPPVVRSPLADPASAADGALKRPRDRPRREAWPLKVLRGLGARAERQND